MGMTPEDLTARHLKHIAEADVLIGGKRLLDHFKDSQTKKKTIGRDIDKVITYIKRQMKHKKIVVLASGDPMFFGIGERLVRALAPQNVLIYPNISTVSAAFARIQEPWSNVRVISLHGKQNEQLLYKALKKEKCIAVYTDPKNNPSRLAARLLFKGFVNFKMCVLEEIGCASERINWYSLSQAAKRTFKEPNLVVLKRIPIETDDKKNIQLGAPDAWYDHPEGLITKAEVRAVTLSKLRLSTGQIFWDLGAGSGSVAIEASLFIRRGKIFAVEKNPQRIEQIKNNKKRFGVKNLKIIQDVLPGGLAKLPQPDRIFIGGGGKHLRDIIKAAAGYLRPQGIMVINTVLIPNLQVAISTLNQHQFETDVIQIQINFSQEMPWAERLEAQNPVWIIAGVRNTKVGFQAQ
jgi:precorrin-6Y C5,15-methyltransferase (decarboxylating)